MEPRILLTPGAVRSDLGADDAVGCSVAAQLEVIVSAGSVRVSVPGQTEPTAAPVPARDPDQAFDDTVAWADLVLIHADAGLGEPALRAAICAAHMGKPLVVCGYRPVERERAAAKWVLESADAVLVSDDASVARLQILVPRARAVVAAPGEEAKRAIAEWSSRFTDAGRVESPAVASAVATGAPDTVVAAPEQRIRDLERSLESALGELSRIHGSRLWRLGEFYWTARPAILLAWRRVTHPIEAGRVAAPRLLPVRLHSRLARALRAGKRKPPAPAPQPSRIGAALSHPISAPEPHPTLLFLPIIEWGFRHQRPQQLATALAVRGWPVLYASCSFEVGGRAASSSPQAEADGVRGLRLPSARHLDVYRDTIDRRSLERMVEAIGALGNQAGIQEAVILCELPFWRPLAQRLHQTLGWPVVYDLLDDHAGFTTNSKAMLREEGRLVAEADLVLASSQRLEDVARRVNLHAIRVSNGCDWPRWSQPLGPGLPAVAPRPVIGYFGAISEWFDTGLVAQLATARPQWSFVLVGSTYGADIGRLARLPNIQLLGERPYVTLPGLAAKFDAGIIPFRRTPLTEATDPVKFYEMMALGLDVVATPLPELAARGDLVRLASTPEEFLNALDDVVGHPRDPALVERRRQFAFANRWETRADAVIEAIPDLYPLVSIVIVTHNNLAFSRMCLESIWRNTTYPNYEVIVVDNGSTDGTREVLDTMARPRPALTVVGNQNNRGFAAACNQGLHLANGWILCLLNNDTVVAPGWLSAMVRALRTDRRAGLVGPVSNAVGNEARIQVGYSEVEEMPAWAARWAVEHGREVLELPMLALFCAAMRREVWEQVGDLDERFEIGMFEDDDYCRRIRQAGYKLLCLRDAFVHHWQRATFRLLGEEEFQRIYERNREAYQAKWRGRNDKL